jgi:hypothetical protein
MEKYLIERREKLDGICKEISLSAKKGFFSLCSTLDARDANTLERAIQSKEAMLSWETALQGRKDCPHLVQLLQNRPIQKLSVIVEEEETDDKTEVDDGDAMTGSNDEMGIVDWGDEKLFLAADKHSSLLGNVKKVERQLKMVRERQETLNVIDDVRKNFKSTIDSYCGGSNRGFWRDLNFFCQDENSELYDTLKSLKNIQEFNRKQRHYLIELKWITAVESCGEAITITGSRGEAPITTIESFGVHYVRRIVWRSRGYRVLEKARRYRKALASWDFATQEGKKADGRHLLLLLQKFPPLQNLPVIEETDSDEIDTNHINIGPMDAADVDAAVEWPSSSACEEGETIRFNVSSPPHKSKRMSQQNVKNVLEDLGSVWMSGRRRSARFQGEKGSIIVNGLRRSARLM